MNTAQDSTPPGEWYCPSCEKQFAVGDRCPNDGTRLVKLKVAIDPFLGRELDGRYTILEKLGQGGMGAVYRSSQHSVGRDCAIKVVSSNLVSDPDVVKRFLREAKLASRLAHPNAVAVLDFGQTDDGVFYLVMELVVGRTLDQVFKAERTFKPERVVRIGSQVCDALEGAHALQIVHRDLKPSNIMLLNRGRDLVKVLDFGLAKSVAPDQTSTTMTNAGALLGTPAFMPPELALGQPCDGRADLYSLGCVLYLLGSGRLPFQSNSAHELIAMHGTEPAPPMTGVPPALGKVIDRLLEKDPARRYQSATEAREALEAAVDGRLYTPPTGVPAANETNPSIGPFPKTTEDLVHDETITPPTPRASSRPRMSTELEQLVTGATMAAVNDTMVHTPVPAAAPPAAAPARRRWLVPAIAAGMLAIGGGAFALTRGAKASDALEQPSIAAPAATPDVAPTAPSNVVPTTSNVAPTASSNVVPAATSNVAPTETAASKPAEPATKLAEPATKPAEPATKPAELATKPAELATKPAEPATKPATSSTRPTAKTIHATSRPAPHVPPTRTKPTTTKPVDTSKPTSGKPVLPF